MIALVITIIVLLILAGISISMLSGDNSILQKATTAKENTDNAQIKERIQLAYHSALTGGQGSYTKESLENELKKEFGENNYNVDDSDNTNWILTAQGQSVTIEAGVSKAPTLITFYIGGSPYEAEEGMTWGEWIENEKYNTTSMQVGPYPNMKINPSSGEFELFVGNGYGDTLQDESDWSYCFASSPIKEGHYYNIYTD